MSDPTVPCPACGRSVVWSTASAWRPFCSERCQLMDLGAWFTEQRSIPDNGSRAGPGEPRPGEKLRD